LTAEDKQRLHELLTQLPGPVNEAAQLAGELTKKLRKGESNSNKVIRILFFIAFVVYLTNFQG